MSGLLAVDVSFWCSTITSPWSWSPRLYPGVWLVVGLMSGSYLVSMSRRARSGASTPHRRRQTAQFLAGVVVVWAASDWPIGLLGASYLSSVHMIQFMMYTLIAAPLLLLGTPEWMARRILGRLRLYRVVGRAARPLVAGIVFNLVMVVTMAPVTTDALRASQFGSFAMDVVWLVAGLVLWLPIVSPLAEHTRFGYGAKMAYLFLAATIVPVFPASFLTFSEFPLYATYELAPRVFDGFSAGSDQAASGLIMKIGSIPIIWGTMLVMMTRWAEAEGVGPSGPRIEPIDATSTAASSQPAASPDSPEPRESDST